MEEKVIDDVQKAQEEIEKGENVLYTMVSIPRTKKKYRVRNPLTPTQLEAITILLNQHSDKSITTETAITQDLRIACKAAVIYLLPGFWKRKLTYWFLWRWFYYVRQYDCIQLQPIISAGYGSTPYIDFLRTVSILSNQKTTLMQMTREEGEKVLQEMALKVKKESDEGKE